LELHQWLLQLQQPGLPVRGAGALEVHQQVQRVNRNSLARLR
jgi:hypothetical protein